MKNGKERKQRNFLREYLELFAETAVFVFFIMTFVAQASQVPTGSMENTILVGDFLLINKLAYCRTAYPIEKRILPRREIEKNDLVVFKSPENKDLSIVKRVIATAGDTVEIRDKKVIVNDKPLAEKYKRHTDSRIIPKNNGAWGESSPRDNFGPVVVPPGTLFVMGDNRDISYDSRFWGFLPLEAVQGRPWMIFFSYRAEENVHLKTSLKDRLRRWTQYIPRARWGRILHIVS
jgi:signal peptidase I